MRTAGTIYEAIESLPAKALPVSHYASQENIAVGQVYIQYRRYLDGYPKTGTKGPYPGYIIRSFRGMNYVIPD